VLVSNRFVDSVDSLISEVSNSRRELHTQSIKQRKNQFRIACGIGCVFDDGEFGFIIQHGIKDIGGVSNGRGNDL